MQALSEAASTCFFPANFTGMYWRKPVGMYRYKRKFVCMYKCIEKQGVGTNCFSKEQLYVFMMNMDLSVIKTRPNTRL